MITVHRGIWIIWTEDATAKTYVDVTGEPVIPADRLEPKWTSPPPPPIDYRRRRHEDRIARRNLLRGAKRK